MVTAGLMVTLYIHYLRSDPLTYDDYFVWAWQKVPSDNEGQQFNCRVMIKLALMWRLTSKVLTSLVRQKSDFLLLQKNH